MAPPSAVHDSEQYSSNVVNGILKEEKKEAGTVSKLSDEHDHVLKTFRLLVADLCEQFKGGHPGYVI